MPLSLSLGLGLSSRNTGGGVPSFALFVNGSPLMVNGSYLVVRYNG